MLRTDLFKTVERGETRFIAVRDTLTPPDPDIDIRSMDEVHCKRGRLGFGMHFLVLTSGDIQLGRGIETCGSHSRGLDDISVAIGVVGGTDEEGERIYTRNPEQEDAIHDLVEFLSLRYPFASVSDRPERD